MKKYLRRTLLLLLAAALGCLGLVSGTTRLQTWQYDAQHENPAVHSVDSIKAILASFPRVHVSQLPSSLKKSSGISEKKFYRLTHDQQFYCLKKKDLYRKIVGDFRILDFVSPEWIPYTASYYSSDTIYWGINPQILYKLCLLQSRLKEQGYDPDAFSVRSGHRTPWFNGFIRGAGRSHHIAGEAVDLTIGDIDKSGSYTERDKKLVLEICEKQVIGNDGGLGLYPGTRAVHLDVRGYKARWNSY